MGLFTNVHEAREYVEERTPILDANKRAILRDCRSGEIKMSTRKLRETLGADIFDAVTLDASHNALMRGYGSVPPDYKSIAQIVSASDFKNRNATRLSGLKNMDTVPKNTEYREFVMLDEKVTYSVEKRGNILRLGLEAVANDEIGAFLSIMEKAGSSAMNTLNEFVIGTKFDDNPTMDYDSAALFVAAGHANLNTSAGLSTTTVSTAVAALMNQTGANAEKIYLRPTALLVSPANMLLAQSIVRSAQIQTGLTTPALGVPSDNAIAGLNLGVIVSPHIDSVATTWYLLSNYPVVELAFLNGVESPEVLVEPENAGMSFLTDSIAYKFRFAFGGEAIDHRGAQRNTA